jgi:predicted flap endonuclease-1-like 5' DNA nuclease
MYMAAIFAITSEWMGWMEDSGGTAPWWVWLIPVVFLVFLVIGVWMRSRGQGVVRPEKNLMGAAQEPKSQPRSTPAPAATEADRPEARKQDELAIISGIGPQIANLLRQSGIDSFSSLADASPEQLQQIIAVSSPGTRVDPTTWPAQARLAAEARWGDLQEFQQSLR